jgi:hypothetical protein
VDQFIPEASPVIAKSGELVVEAEPLVKLGGDPVASNVDNRFDALVGLEIKLDMRLNISVQKPAIFTQTPPPTRHGCFADIYDKISDGVKTPSENVTNSTKPTNPTLRIKRR